eukprot:TRINITY_DN61300_c0_g1_i1.p1 TRINITY_DN61300_c0_g1~~TRINITY_DN61300_c0_g1_i1.p1  ORF type:complete len:927 (+),score=215.19 TRINITY_DN61300_c0_g1_i1:358-2781(+)
MDEWMSVLKGDEELVGNLPDDLRVLLDDPAAPAAEVAAPAPVADAPAPSATAAAPAPAAVAASPAPAAVAAAPAAVSATPEAKKTEAGPPATPVAPTPVPAPPAEVPAAAAPKPAAAAPSVSTPSIASAPPPDTDVTSAIEAAKAKTSGGYSGAAVAAPVAKSALSAVAKNLDQLQKGTAHIEALNYSAKNTDEAVTAFETFRQAVGKVVRSTDKEDDVVLEQLEPKGKILEFLVEFQERKRLSRARVAATLTLLMSFESWAQAALEDASVLAACRELAVDTGSLGGGDDEAVASVPSLAALPAAGKPGLHKINLRSSAAAAASHGGIGALFVRVLSGKNLVNGEGSSTCDPYVRVTVADRTKRTDVFSDSLNPTWDAAPFVFEIPDAKTQVLFEVIDNSFIKSELVGKATVLATSASDKAGAPPMRFPLDGAAHGEIEVELIFASASEEDFHAHETAGIAAAALGPAAVSTESRDVPVASASDSPPPVATRHDTGGYAVSGSDAPKAPTDSKVSSSVGDGAASGPAVGQKMEYHSASAGRWIGCTITAVQAGGAVQVDCKPGTWLSPAEVGRLLRVPPAREAFRTSPAPTGSTTAGPVGALVVGQSVEYNSATAGRWLPCKVTSADPEGAVQLDIKPGYWMPVEEQKSKLRTVPRRGGEAAPPASSAALKASASPAPASGLAPRASTAATYTCVAWVTVEPRSGDLNFYPSNVATMLEEAWQRGDDGKELGAAFFGATVFLRPRMVQRTAKGSRDVRRVELQTPQDPVLVFVAKERDWRAAETPFSPGAEERRKIAPPDTLAPRIS